ncbi:oligosaccharide flippase family protein [Flavobacterium sp.]|uniref:oligosaccharide flippase family protein n=1 Tax=Flavobacterium sp. TaxID=239 RepID=UPI0025C62390|nr:oligosaccharide flippase family protein [Flavobacterium sp.]
MLKRLLNKQTLNLGVYGIGQAFNLITPLLVIPYIVGICGEDGYGKTAVGMALSFFLMVFIDYGSDIVGVKSVSVSRDDPKKLSQIFATTYLAKFFTLSLVLIAASLMFLFIPFFSVEKRLFFLGLPVLLGQCVNPTWFLQGVENFKWITILTIISKTIYVVGVFLMISNPEDYIYNNLVWGIGMIVAHLIVVGYLFTQYPIRFSDANRHDVKTLLRSNFSIFSSQIFVSLQMYAPTMLISFFGGNALTGQFKIVDQIVVIFKTYILLFFNFVFPRICYLLEIDKHQGLLFWKRYNGANFAFIALSMVAIFIFATPIVSYFNPKGIGEIVFLLRIAVAIPLLQAVTVPLKQLMLGWDKQKEYVRYTMIITIVSLLAIVLAIPFFHVQGLLCVLIATEILSSALFFASVKSNFFLRG